MEKSSERDGTLLTVVESAQILHESMRSEITSSLNIMKNETLYNLSVESPLLRDADILDPQSISATWRGTLNLSEADDRCVITERGGTQGMGDTKNPGK